MSFKSHSHWADRSFVARALRLLALSAAMAVMTGCATAPGSDLAPPGDLSADGVSTSPSTPPAPAAPPGGQLPGAEGTRPVVPEPPKPGAQPSRPAPPVVVDPALLKQVEAARLVRRCWQAAQNKANGLASNKYIVSSCQKLEADFKAQYGVDAW